LAYEFGRRKTGFPAGVARAARRAHYSPYAVDWRFLPEQLLLAKDWLRYRLARASNVLAETPATADLWASTLGRRVARTVTSAGVLFIHVPKTGGTSISKVLYGRNLPHYTAQFWATTYGDKIIGVPSFAVIRNPVQRLLSAYKMALFGGTDIVAYSRYWRSRLHGLQSVECFVDFLEESTRRGEELPLDLRAQAGFILDENGAVMVDRLFRLDARHGLASDLGQWLGASPIPRLNATPLLDTSSSPAIEAKLRDIYRVDFALYEAIAAAGGSAGLRGVRFNPG